MLTRDKIKRTYRIDFSLETMLEAFLGFAEIFAALDLVEVSQHAHHTRKSMHLEDIQIFEGLHFEPKVTIDHEENEIGHLGRVDHGVEIVLAFEKGHN